MKKLAIIIISFLSLAVFARAATDESTPLLESTSKDQIALSLTVYNNDIGLVKIPAQYGSQKESVSSGLWILLVAFYRKQFI